MHECLLKVLKIERKIHDIDMKIRIHDIAKPLNCTVYMCCHTALCKVIGNSWCDIVRNIYIYIYIMIDIFVNR